MRIQDLCNKIWRDAWSAVKDKVSDDIELKFRYDLRPQVDQPVRAQVCYQVKGVLHASKPV